MIPDPCFDANGTATGPTDYLPYLVPIATWIRAYAGTVTVLLLGGYGAQMYKLYRYKSARGISIVTFHMAGYGVATSLTAIWVVSQTKFLACFQDVGRCLPDLLTLIQVFLAFVGLLWLYTLVLWYMYKDVGRTRLFKASCGVYLGLVGYLLVQGVTSTTVGLRHGMCDAHVQRYVYALSVISSCCSLAQYVPQLVKTVRTKGDGYLSLAMLCIQAPVSVSYVVVMFLTRVEWFSGLALIVNAALELLLTILLVAYKALRRRRARKLRLPKPLCRNESMEVPALVMVQNRSFDQIMLTPQVVGRKSVMKTPESILNISPLGSEY